jgi:MT-A70
MTLRASATITNSVPTPSIRVRCLHCGQPFVAIRRSAKTCSDACRQRLSRAQRAATPPLPPGPFDLIYADPAWDFVTYCRVRRWAALRVYGPMLPQGIELMKCWGFTYKSDLITWVKTTSKGKLAFGTGYFTRKGTEQLFYGTRGRGLKRVDSAVRQCLLAERREHSRKPDEVAELLERLFGPVRRIELFARRMRPGWTCWGNELPEQE